MINDDDLNSYTHHNYYKYQNKITNIRIGLLTCSYIYNQLYLKITKSYSILVLI